MERMFNAGGARKFHAMVLIILLALLGLTLNLQAQVVNLTNQHMDFRLQYDPSATGSNRLSLILGYDPGQRATNPQVYIVGNTNAKVNIPANPNYTFLGAAGTPIWILPQSQNISLPYLGISAEDIANGVFQDPMQMELVSVEGPGNFFMWSVSGAGQPPTVKMIATNGVVASQFNKADVFIGSHEHNNWGFSTNGLYRVTFRANGKFLGAATNTLGRDVAWSFQILPLRPWESWVATNWLPATASNTNGPAADPDGDGIVNVFEYAFGNDPNVALYSNAPAITFVNDTGTNYGALRFVRAPNATDLDFVPVAANTLTDASWSNLTDIFSVTSAAGRQIVTVRDSLAKEATTNRFYQLRAKLNYP